jgi:outer membrane receptor protein involved in Fe transport
VKLFHNTYKQLINNDISNTPDVLDNMDSAKTYGAEFEINYRPDRNNILHAGYAFTHVKQASDERLTSSIPKHNFNCSFRTNTTMVGVVALSITTWARCNT